MPEQNHLRRGATVTPTRQRRPRVLHLGYEDPAKPGAGGGSVRTHEINQRLADEFDIVVACARFDGAAPYSCDGVRYTHIGAGRRYTPAIMTYFAAQPAAVALWRPDLIVEDFGAPLSIWGLPRLTRRPVLGVVQWLFAHEKARQYHLPFGAVETVGVHSHRTLIAVSDDLGAQLARRSPGAQVHVVPNGLPAVAFTTASAPTRQHIAYLGRLEEAQKGVSMLMHAYAQAVAAGIEQDLLIAGTGPDESTLRRLVNQRGLQDRVRFVGLVPLAERFAWLAKAQFVVMPSRYETFGMVAAESLAVGTPVVAFDIDCLRSLVTNATGRRVPAFDVAALGRAIIELANTPRLREDLSQGARASVRHLTWDTAATDQARIYRQALRR